MKVLFIVGLLVTANVLWFNMLAELRRRGYAVSYVNFLADLKAYHSLIVTTRTHHDHHKFTLALIVLYAVIAAAALAILFL